MPASRCIARIAYERIPFGHSPSCHHHPPRLTTPSPLRLTGAHGYIRLEIKSAIVSPLNELSHAYAYSRSSARVCVYSRPVRLLHARTSLVRARARIHLRVCATTVGAPSIRARARVCPSVCVCTRRCVRSRARRSRFQEVQGSIGVRPVDPGTYSPHPHTDA